MTVEQFNEGLNSRLDGKPRPVSRKVVENELAQFRLAQQRAQEDLQGM